MEKTLTFTVEDALLSPLGFSILSGAGLFDKTSQPVHVHQTAKQVLSVTQSGATIDITDALLYGNNQYNMIDAEAPIFITVMDDDSLTSTMLKITTTPTTEADGAFAGAKVFKPTTVDNITTLTLTVTAEDSATALTTADNGKTVFVDYYILKTEDKAMELQINAEDFAGTYYVEADTLVRKQSNGKDIPAIITLPLVKIQSNFTFTMASSGDPSTFTFTMDAMPGYTYFNRKKKVLCVMQIIDETGAAAKPDAVMRHGTGYSHGDANSTDVTKVDSYYTTG